MQKRSKKLVIILSMAALIVAVLPHLAGKASAASAPQFASVAVRLDKITVTTFTASTVCIATPTSSSGITDFGSENYVDVGFPDEQGVVSGATDFQVSTTTANWITSTTVPAPGSPGTGSQYWPDLNYAPTAASAWPGIGATAVGATNTSYTVGDPHTLRIVRFAMTGLATSKTYCFDIADGSGTPGAETSGTASLTTAALGTDGFDENVPGFVSTYDCATSCTVPGNGVQVESSNWGTQLVPALGNQIVVSAVVPPIFEMIFTANTDSFPVNLSPTAVIQTTGQGVQVATNAKGGWVVWIKSQNKALTSASSGGSIPSVTWNSDAVTDLVAGTPAYNINAAVTADPLTLGGLTKCTPQPESEYGGAEPATLAAFGGGEATPNWEMAADCSTATPPGTDDGTLVKFTEQAAISFATPAASDYTDTIFVTGAGQF